MFACAAVVSKDVMDRSNFGANASPIRGSFSSFRESNDMDEIDDDGNNGKDTFLECGEGETEEKEEAEEGEDVNEDDERSVSSSRASPSSGSTRRNLDRSSPNDDSKDESFHNPKGKSVYNQAGECHSGSSDKKPSESREFGRVSRELGTAVKYTRDPIRSVQGPREQRFTSITTETVKKRGSVTEYVSASQSFTNVRHRSRSENLDSPVTTASSHPMAGRTSAAQNQTYKTLFEEYFNLRLALLFFCFVTLFMALSLYQTSHDDQLSANSTLKIDLDEILNDFLEAFDRLNGSFPAQTSMFWKVLRAGTRSIMRPSPPDQPAVFIIAVPQGAEQTALCIARRYADVVTKAFKVHGTIEFLQHLRGADTPERIKEAIDDTLNSGFLRGSKVAIVHELNRLHGQSAMMFHGYCDNENAPFTRVAFVLMLHMDADGGETDDLVERRLSNVWGNYLDRDTLLPLLSRIGNRNAFVRQESDEILQANGC